ncbi:IS481 family transposase [Streptomyces rubiginosohelvolus]|uniref:IS481 family transposase n=1 Tax=Streptomyces rubiginosohelvolus TaxID=67362 RepID=UPI0036975B78
MVHRNTPLTETGRLRLARCVVEDGWPVRRAAERFQVSHTTAARWACRYRQHGVTAMSDRSSRPHHQPRRTPATVEEQVLRLRREHRIGPLRLAVRCGIAASTAHRILVRHGLPPLAALDRATGEPVRRYERARPGELVHIDVRSWAGSPTAAAQDSRPGRGPPQPDQRRRLGLSAHRPRRPQPHRLHRRPARRDRPDLRSFLVRASAYFASLGIRIERVLTDNAWAYSKNTWRNTCRDLDISPRWTRPWRPQTNGKVERFHRTLLDEWAYQKPYTSDRDRMEAFTHWLHWYNYHRPHTAIGGHTPASRGTNLSEPHI